MENQNTPKLAYSVAEACAALGLGKTNFYRLISVGQIETVKVGGRRLVPVAAIEALLDKARAAERDTGAEE